MTVAWATIENALYTWIVNATGLATIWEQQNAPRPAAPYISLHVTEVRPLGQDWISRVDNPLVFSDITLTPVDASGSFTATAHGRLTGDGPVQVVTTLTLPTGVDTSTDYYVVRVDANSFKLATTLLNAMAVSPTTITFSGVGSGTIKLVDTASTLRVGEAQINYARGPRAFTLTATCFATTSTGASSAVSALEKATLSARLPSAQVAFYTAGMGLSGFERVQSVNGIMNFASFEPRAILTSNWFTVTEISEFGEIVSSVGVNGETVP